MIYFFFFFTVTIFKYDERFRIYDSDFISRNYKFLLRIFGDMSNFYDSVIANPPFLSDECFAKTVLTIKFLILQLIL